MKRIQRTIPIPEHFRSLAIREIPISPGPVPVQTSIIIDGAAREARTEDKQIAQVHTNEITRHRANSLINIPRDFIRADPLGPPVGIPPSHYRRRIDA